MDFPHAVHSTGIKQNAFACRGLARINVGNDPDIANGGQGTDTIRRFTLARFPCGSTLFILFQNRFHLIH
jgi:hypothetical protein